MFKLRNLALFELDCSNTSQKSWDGLIEGGLEVVLERNNWGNAL